MRRQERQGPDLHPVREHRLTRLLGVGHRQRTIAALEEQDRLPFVAGPVRQVLGQDPVPVVRHPVVAQERCVGDDDDRRLGFRIPDRNDERSAIGRQQHGVLSPQRILLDRHSQIAVDDDLRHPIPQTVRQISRDPFDAAAPASAPSIEPRIVDRLVIAPQSSQVVRDRFAQSPPIGHLLRRIDLRQHPFEIVAVGAILRQDHDQRPIPALGHPTFQPSPLLFGQRSLDRRSPDDRRILVDPGREAIPASHLAPQAFVKLRELGEPVQTLRPVGANRPVFDQRIGFLRRQRRFDRHRQQHRRERHGKQPERQPSQRRTSRRIRRSSIRSSTIVSRPLPVVHARASSNWWKRSSSRQQRSNSPG